MIFLTIGSTNIPFDRLIKAIDRAKGVKIIEDDIFGQIGCSKYTPKNFSFKRFLDKKEFDKYYSQADLIIGHAGMGTIMMSLEMKKSLLIVPRLKQFKEHVNDHQKMTALKFEELNHVVVLYDPTNLELLKNKIEEAINFIPIPRISLGDDLAKDIFTYIESIQDL